MRRVISIILFVLGGWLLTSEVMFAWSDMGVGMLGQLAALAFMAAFATVFLLPATVISPGNRPAELGLVLMIVAGVGMAMGLVTFMAMNDPAVAKMMPPGQEMPDIVINPLVGALNLLLIAGSGFALWHWGRARVRQGKPDLEQVFE